MKSLPECLFIILSCLFLHSVPVHAEINQEIEQLQLEWAQIKYILDKKDHETALEKLAAKAAIIRENQTDNADAYLWEGIILSTYAGAIGTLRALDAVNESRSALEKSLELDLNASNGAANTYLGTLYFLVPEWPIAFGDMDLAKEYLDRAIKLDPDDIDVNYFYGEFLRKKKRYQQAEVWYKNAIKAPARSGREIADAGRRQEAENRIQEIIAELN
jgi:tetratricopeptide (TPR) repeat protein